MVTYRPNYLFAVVGNLTIQTSFWTKTCLSILTTR